MKKLNEQVIPALVTPLNKNRTADLLGLDKIIEYLNNKECNKFVLFGTSGEFSLINESVKSSILNHLKLKSKSNKFIIACNSENYDDLDYKLKKYEKYDFVEGYLVAPPYYFNLTQKELFSFYKKILNIVNKPILYYNIPQLTGISLDINTIVKLSNLGIFGIKDSSGDISFLNKLTTFKKLKNDFKIYVGGSRILLQALNMGIDGVIGLGSNINPKLEIDLINFFNEKNYKKALDQQILCDKHNEFLNNYPYFQQSIAKGILSKMHIIKKHVCFPKQELDKQNTSLIYNEYIKLFGKIT